MSLRVKLVIIIVFVALVPLVVSALTTLSLHQQAFDGKVSELHRKIGEHAGSQAQSYFDSTERALTLAVQSIRWTDLSDAERNGALWLAYRQQRDIAAVALLDARGEGLGPSVYLDDQSEVQAMQAHPVATMEMLTVFAQRIPFAEAQKNGAAMGEVFAVSGNDSPFLPMAIRVQGPGESPWVVAVCLSLQTLCRDIARGALGSAQTQVYLVEPQGHALCRTGQESPLVKSPPEILNAASAEGDPGGHVRRLTDAAGEPILAAVVRAASGWLAVAEQPEAVALASSRRIRMQTLFWIGLSLVIALVAGLFLAQSINRPVRKLVEGALQLAQGNFGYRLAAGGRDELGKLSETFNHMGIEIEKRDHEICTWNEELKARVIERTRELKEAQDQLLQSQKIAAVTSLGAGVAHEINNPLTGVVGLTQVLKTKLRKLDGMDKYVKLLTQVEKEALRIKGIVHTLLTFSQNYAGSGRAPLNIQEVLDESLELVKGQVGREGIELVRDYESGLPPVLGNKTQLQQVFLHLLNNARTAMHGKGGRLTLSVSSMDGELVKVAVQDTGKGIPPENLDKIFEPFFATKENWEGQGLGLTVAFRIIEEHHGKIKVQSEVGLGTTMTMTFPAARRGAHLV